MLVRSAMFVCAAAAIASTAALAQTSASPALCEETTFRIYFAHNSAALNSNARELIDAAERNVAGCSHSELQVAVRGPRAAARGAAIRTALNDRAWNAVHLTPLRLQRASAGPDYAEVLMTPRVLPAPPPLAPEREREAETETGV